MRRYFLCIMFFEGALHPGKVTHGLCGMSSDEFYTHTHVLKHVLRCAVFSFSVAGARGGRLSTAFLRFTGPVRVFDQNVDFVAFSLSAYSIWIQQKKNSSWNLQRYKDKKKKNVWLACEKTPSKNSKTRQ